MEYAAGMVMSHQYVYIYFNCNAGVPPVLLTPVA